MLRDRRPHLGVGEGKANSLGLQTVVGFGIQAEAAFPALWKAKGDDFVTWNNAHPMLGASLWAGPEGAAQQHLGGELNPGCVFVCVCVIWFHRGHSFSNAFHNPSSFVAWDNWEICIGKATFQKVFICATDASGHNLFGEQRVDDLASV